ncbi:MAG: response regulator, partial [Novosphingobium sp.]
MANLHNQREFAGTFRRFLIYVRMCQVSIIEDELLVAFLIRDILEDQGATSFSFAATENGAVAAAIDAPPGLIASDVQLLAGSGPQAVASIRQRIGPIPVIFISA